MLQSMFLEKRKYHDWFDEHEEEIQQLLKEKKDTRKMNYYLRDKIRQIKNDWFQRKAEEAEKYSQEKNHRVTVNSLLH